MHPPPHTRTIFNNYLDPKKVFVTPMKVFNPEVAARVKPSVAGPSIVAAGIQSLVADAGKSADAAVALQSVTWCWLTYPSMCASYRTMQTVLLHLAAVGSALQGSSLPIVSQV